MAAGNFTRTLVRKYVNAESEKLREDVSKKSLLDERTDQFKNLWPQTESQMTGYTKRSVNSGGTPMNADDDQCAVYQCANRSDPNIGVSVPRPVLQA